MNKAKLYTKFGVLLLLVALFCSACDVPDISEFTNQSAEMTRGVRKGVKDTENLIKTASARDDLFSDDTRTQLGKDLKSYQKAVKPTVAALDGLDNYLGALNALAQANQKSGENAAGVVSAVTGLVAEVSGFTFASEIVNVGKGLVTLAEKFRTAKDFRVRVTLAAEIVEGIHPKLDERGKQLKDERGQVIYVRNCKGDAAEQIAKDSIEIRSIVDPIIAQLRDSELKILKSLPADQKRAQLHNWGKLSDADFVKASMAQARIEGYGCGVIDLIKFNLKELQDINLSISETMFTNARLKNQVVLGYYESILANDRNIQNESARILNFKELLPLISEYFRAGADSRAVATRITLKQTLDSIFAIDPPLAATIIPKIQSCPDCGEMLAAVRAPSGSMCKKACRDNLTLIFQKMTIPQFNKSISLILPALDNRRSELDKENERYLADLARIKPSYDEVMAELNSMKDKQNQLDSLLGSSLKALDAWSESHANLRVAVNTKKPLNVAKLASQVREIWSIINPESN